MTNSFFGESTLNDERTSLDVPGSEYKPVARVDLLGCPVEKLTLEQTVSEVNKIIGTRKPHQHCVINAGKVILMHRDPVLREIIHSCPIINADGQSVVWALKLLGKPIPERVTGIDLMERLFAEADSRRYRVYFLGSKQDVLNLLLNHIGNFFPNLVVAGSRHGYFQESENESLVSEIARSNADILFVAMGSPKKEYWIAKNINNLNVPFCMGVGGSFDVVAGKVARAPRWIQRIGMEWFFRFSQEPRRLWRRYWVDNFIFIYLIFLQFLGINPLLKSKSSQELKNQENT